MQEFGNRIILSENNCWEWQGSKINGYGKITLKGKSFWIHRIFYSLFKGRITKNSTIDHLCRNPKCCNPLHLEAVKHKENIRRGIKGVLTTHCPSGHEYSGDNLRLRKPNNWRVCRTCHRVRERNRKYAFMGK